MKSPACTINQIIYPVALLIISALITTSVTTAESRAPERGEPEKAASVFAYESYVDANYILMFVTNTGMLGRDVSGVFGYDNGTFYPYSGIANIQNGSNTLSPLYGAGLCLGGVVGSETRVAACMYSSEFYPGPMESGTYVATGGSDPHYHVYKIFSDSTGGLANDDYLNWPSDEGAPLNGASEPYLLGTQTLWCVYNDANPSQHTLGIGSTNPLGIEVRQTVWASPAINRSQVVFVQFVLYNEGGNTINDFYISLFADFDLGFAGDDLIGCDTISDIFYAYNGDNDDSQYGTQPPAVGFKVLKGPVVPSPGDSAYFNGVYLHDYANMEMSTFRSWNGDPNDFQELYYFMQGLQANGAPLANGTRYSVPGDPVTGTGDLDFSPTDKKCMGSFGPLTFAPGDSQCVVFMLGCDAGPDRLSSITALKNTLNLPQELPLDVDEDDGGKELLPDRMYLHQNYPNPFNPETTIHYSLPEPTHVKLEIFNLLGQRVSTLVDAPRSAGEHYETWVALDGNGEPLASGVYIYRLTTDSQTSSRQMILLK